MTKLAPVSAFGALALAAAAAAFSADPHLLRRLKSIDGYRRLYELDRVRAKLAATAHEAAKDFFLYHQADLPVWDMARADFRVRAFERPCSQLDELYRKGRSYFASLPQAAADRDKDMLCKVRAVRAQCDGYLAGDFVEHLYDAVVRHRREHGEGALGQWIRASFGGAAAAHNRKVNSSRARVRRPGWGRDTPGGYEFR